MIELGIGFHHDLTGAENLFLSASVHGLTRAQIEALYDRIVEYSGLAAFMDVPMKNYSSGMTVRLAFAIAANLDPDMLLLDEVFAVGDEAFQQQCIRTVRQFRADGKTILFVSHSARGNPERLRSRMPARSGRLLFDGAVSRGLEEYHRVAPAVRAWVRLQRWIQHRRGRRRLAPGRAGRTLGRVGRMGLSAAPRRRASARRFGARHGVRQSQHRPSLVEISRPRPLLGLRRESGAHPGRRRPWSCRDSCAVRARLLIFSIQEFDLIKRAADVSIRDLRGTVLAPSA